MGVVMTKELLRERQRWTLEQKIDHALGTIEAFVNRLGLDKVYISFSGGKDSAVLSHLARTLYPNILHVFINTGNEWPEILQYVSVCEHEGMNLLRLRPKLTPKQVWDKSGFPLVGKEVAKMIYETRFNPDTKTAHRRLDKSNRYRIPDRYLYLLQEPYIVSHKCCNELKKKPAKCFEKESGRAPIIGIMASESIVREAAYIKKGACNVFADKGRSFSCPLSIWLEDDIWAYIEKFKIQISDIYRKGAERTGCVGCGFGCQFKNDHRLELLHTLHPKYYQMIMGYTNNGVTYREAVSKIYSIFGKILPD